LLSTQGPATNCISWILQWRRSYHSFNISDYNISIPKLGHPSPPVHELG
jgi:hypothetical protein